MDVSTCSAARGPASPDYNLLHPVGKQQIRLQPVEQRPGLGAIQFRQRDRRAFSTPASGSAGSAARKKRVSAASRSAK